MKWNEILISYTETNDQCSTRKKRYYSIDGGICMKTADSADLRGLFIAEPVDAPRTTRVDSYLVWPELEPPRASLKRVTIQPMPFDRDLWLSLQADGSQKKDQQRLPSALPEN
uniref:Uncharacterized protein n=1 Tax=Vespula pensylvanica TaxID=30213 RepID=A0A834PFT6_VESPE|nr:hypothetical protein H0235_001256 [Vespula pensylvanica]